MNSITYREFSTWLKGYLNGNKDIHPYIQLEILEKLSTVMDEQYYGETIIIDSDLPVIDFNDDDNNIEKRNKKDNRFKIKGV